MARMVWLFAGLLVLPLVALSDNHHLSLEVDGKRIDVMPGVKVKDVEAISDCVQREWNRGFLTHREAALILVRLTAVDEDRIPGRLFSFHGDSWVSYGHWPENLGYMDHIVYEATHQKFSIEDAIDRRLIENKLAEQKDGYVEYKKSRLSKSERKKLVSILNEVEEMLASITELSGSFSRAPSVPALCEFKLIELSLGKEQGDDAGIEKDSRLDINPQLTSPPR